MNSIEYIFVFTSTEEYPKAAVDMAVQLAEAAEKPVCFVSYCDKKIPLQPDEIEAKLAEWASKLSPKVTKGAENYLLPSLSEFHDFMTASEASTIVFQLSEHKGFNKVRTFLKITRDLRIPYIFVKPYFDKIVLDKVLVPVTFLVEDNEKGPFAANLGRFFGSELLLMPAKDFGHKARITTDKITTLLDKYELKHNEIAAQGDSFKVELEAVRRADELGAGMVIASASRSYGLDDIIFGPKELGFINECSVPVMLLNPRADLYVLCG